MHHSSSSRSSRQVAPVSRSERGGLVQLAHYLRRKPHRREAPMSRPVSPPAADRPCAQSSAGRAPLVRAFPAQLLRRARPDSSACRAPQSLQPLADATDRGRDGLRPRTARPGVSSGPAKCMWDTVLRECYGRSWHAFSCPQFTQHGAESQSSNSLQIASMGSPHDSGGHTQPSGITGSAGMLPMTFLAFLVAPEVVVQFIEERCFVAA
jgi:hypothetical protein